ncbi:hypothetical protein D6779_10310 [Candidatus Parcubacteria bacterium]|nr:MAG: hypothetical protein D6779_10310 [Candidatus Parcubacteria bacterium]
MTKKSYLAAGVVILLLAGGYLLFRSSQNSQIPSSPQNDIVQPSNEEQSLPAAVSPQAPSGAQAVITYTDEGFSPPTLTVQKGTKVVFENKSSREMWPASAVHPTHTVYPGSGIEKCGTPEASTIFDACGGIAPGESWSFVFQEAGTWKYHDHLAPGNTGTIIVIEPPVQE